MTFTPDEFRKILAAFPTGIAVATARAPDGRLQGTTVSSFNSVSLDPPLVLFSLARTVQSFPGWQFPCSNSIIQRHHRKSDDGSLLRASIRPESCKSPSISIASHSQKPSQATALKGADKRPSFGRGVTNYLTVDAVDAVLRWASS
jgi:Flavin reductase like domain